MGRTKDRIKNIEDAPESLKCWVSGKTLELLYLLSV